MKSKSSGEPRLSIQSQYSPEQMRRARLDAVMTQEAESQPGRRPGTRRPLMRHWRRAAIPRRWRQKLLILASLLFALALIALLPVFRIHTIEVRGATTLRPEAVIQACGMREGQHMVEGLGGSLESLLRLRYAGAEALAHKNLPHLRQVRIYPSLPSKLIVEVQERQAIAFVQDGMGAYAVDADGVVLQMTTQEPKNRPLIEGLKTAFVEVGQKIDETSRQVIQQTVTLIDQAITADEAANDGESFVERIKTIRVLSPRLFLLGISINETQMLYVQVASDGPAGRIYWLRNAYHSKAFDKLEEGILDLSGKTRVFMPVRNIGLGQFAQVQREKEGSKPEVTTEASGTIETKP